MHDEEAINPCPHMRQLVSQYADGTLRGLILAYVRYHVGHCGRCNRAYQALLALRKRLSSFRSSRSESLGDERWAKIRAELDDSDVSR